VEIFDLSVPIRPGMIVYPGDPVVQIERVLSLADGEIANVSRLDFGVHSGTHVDAPLHFFDDTRGVDAVPLDVLVGPVNVLDLTGVEGTIAATDLEPFELAGRVILKTTNSKLWSRDTYTEGAVSVGPDAAQLLVDRGVRLVGIDYLSIGDLDTHRILLGAGVVPVEGLDLRAVEPGPYLLVCAPLRIEGSDGGPARALLIRER
jgi:arylformamidase